MKRVIFTGGGTGGHVYPALPIIKKLQELNYEILWIGSAGGIEEKIVNSWGGIEYHSVSTGKLRRYFSLRNFTDVFRIVWGLLQSLFLLKKLKPELVFSKGGFVSVPPVVAAAILKIPSFTHDSDVIPGLATRINHRFTKKTFVAYEESNKYLNRPEKVVVSGNPVRDVFFKKGQTLPAPWDVISNEKPMIMVLGGSSGARQINEMITDIVDQLCPSVSIVHQMGEGLYEVKEQDSYYPVPYLNEELPALLERADLAISRAGAGSLWELAVSETPSILIPLRVGSRGDQVQNAEIVENRDMAIVLHEQNPESRELLKQIRGLMSDDSKRNMMKKNCQEFVKIKAEDVIVQYLVEDHK